MTWLTSDSIYTFAHQHTVHALSCPHVKDGAMRVFKSVLIIELLVELGWEKL